MEGHGAIISRPSELLFVAVLLDFVTFKSPAAIMPVDNPEIIQTAGLDDLHANGGRRESVIRPKGVDGTVVETPRRDFEFEMVPTQEELHGPSALRRVPAPIPWAVYTVAFVELCERFSYYGTQVVCKWFFNPSLFRKYAMKDCCIEKGPGL